MKTYLVRDNQPKIDNLRRISSYNQKLPDRSGNDDLEVDENTLPIGLASGSADWVLSRSQASKASRTILLVVRPMRISIMSHMWNNGCPPC